MTKTTHYLKGRVPACGARGTEESRLKMSDDKRRVTCERCIKTVVYKTRGNR